MGIMSWLRRWLFPKRSRRALPAPATAETLAGTAPTIDAETPEGTAPTIDAETLLGTAPANAVTLALTATPKAEQLALTVPTNTETRALAAPSKAAAPIEFFDPDRPRAIGENDALRRARWVQVFSQQLKRIPVDDSFVFSLEGPWGSGKTSVLDTLERDLTQAGIVVLRFNPWLFAGTHDLVGSFFRELSAQLEHKPHRLNAIASAFGSLAGALGAIGLAAGNSTLAMLAAVSKASSEAVVQAAALQSVPSLFETKRKIAADLRSSKTRLIVLVDDLERLTGREVLDVLRAVRVIADLPGLVYVLAFDREQLVKALGREGEGALFLDKIVQIPMRLPDPPSDGLQGLLFARLDAILAQVDHTDLHREHWNELALGVVLPLIKTPRDAVRLSNAVAAALAHLGDEVAVEEIFAMEALRIAEPAFFSALKSQRTHLTCGEDVQVAWARATQKRSKPRHSNSGPDAPEPSTRDALLAHANNKEICRTALKLIFKPLNEIEPQGGFGSTYDQRELRKHRRLGLTEVFDLYFEAALRPDLLDLSVVASISSSPPDDDLATVLQSVRPEQLTYLFTAIADHARELSVRADVHDLLVLLLPHANRLPPREVGFLSERPEISVARLLRRIMEQYKNIEERRTFWRTLLGRAPASLAPCLADISETIGKQWVSGLGFEQSEVDECHEQLRATIRAFDAAQFRALREPAWLLPWAFQPSKSDVHRQQLQILLQDDVLLAKFTASSFLRKAYSTGLIELEFNGSAFEGMFESEEELRRRLAAIGGTPILPPLERETLSRRLAQAESLLTPLKRHHYEDDDDN
jgi:hypothetical protein